MAKKNKRKLLFITVILSMLFISSTYAALIPNVHAAEMTTQQKGIAILNDVVGLDMSKYSTATTEGPPDSYLGVVPQENVRYTLESNGSRVDMRYTFANGKLRKIHVLESEGPLRLTKTATNTLEMAKDFLIDYQSYSRNSFYNELGLMLRNVDAGKNSTKTSGNVKLKVTDSGSSTTFKWTYTFNGVEAPDKCVALGYRDGFLKYFIDNWDLYKIGSSSVNLSEEEAKDIAMERSETFSWKMGSGNITSEVKNFNVANAMVWETVFLSNLYADEPRSEDPLMLYPMRHVWVSLDKFYPGNVYGFNVYVWADTGEVCYIHERVSTLDPPPDLVATVDDFTYEPLDNQEQRDETQFNSMSIPWILLSTLAVVMLGTVSAWFLLGKKKNMAKLRFFKVGGVLLCVLTFSTILLVPISTVNATSTNERVEIWGSESTGAYDSRIPGSWRKTSNEIYYQQMLSNLIDFYFSYYGGNNYDASNNQGSDSLKNLILDDISYAEANYPRVAVVDFDHGQGRSDYQGLNEFHFMFEDDIGTATGDRDHIIWVPENGVYDMDIYPRTALGKVFFAFINTCGSANLSNLETGNPWQGLTPGTYRARGMPFAWTHKRVIYEMGINGYYYPDGGDFCYIGFPFGSAALDQTISGSGPKYWEWVRDFFWYALSSDISVNDALDEASYEHFEEEFGDTDLKMGFIANWPMWTYGWEDVLFSDSRMVVYGNGDIQLYRKGGIWNLDENELSTAHDSSSHDNDGTIYGANWTTGKFGSALIFDGDNDYMEVYPFDFDFTEITAEFWMKTSDTTKSGTPISCSSGTQHNEFLLYNYKSFAIYIKGSSVNTAVSANDGDWHHIAVTWRKSDGRVKLYKDGTEAYSGTLQAGATINLANLVIGQEQDSFRGGFDASQAFKGIIDQIRIYDYVLSAGQIADNAAVASYHLNGGEYAYDSSPCGNTGTVYGASWATGVRTSGGHSLALSFDGVNDYVEVASSDSLRVSNAVTITAWIKVSRKSGDTSDQIIVSKNGYDYILNVFGTWRGADVGKIEVGGLALSPRWLVGSKVVDDNKWHLIAFTYDGSTKKIFVDGDLDDSASTSGSFDSTTGPLRIGRQPSGDARQVNGVIDEVRIYDRALSEDEIADYYAANLPYHWVIVDTVPPITPYIDIQIDDQYGSIASVSRGSHTVEVSDSYCHPYYGWFFFDHYTYDSTTDYNNPMTLTVSKDQEVIAYYTWYGW